MHNRIRIDTLPFCFGLNERVKREVGFLLEMRVFLTRQSLFSSHSRSRARNSIEKGKVLICFREVSS